MAKRIEGVQFCIEPLYMLQKIFADRSGASVYLFSMSLCGPLQSCYPAGKFLNSSAGGF